MTKLTMEGKPYAMDRMLTIRNTRKCILHLYKHMIIGKIAKSLEIHDKLPILEVLFVINASLICHFNLNRMAECFI